MTTEQDRGGAASVEAAVAALGIAILIAFGLAAGRLTTAEAAATEAARAAARMASIERDPGRGRTVATGEARRVLAGQGLSCAPLDVVVDRPTAAIGAPSMATATVRCAVRWSDLGLPGAPGTHDLVASFTSAVDRYRERS